MSRGSPRYSAATPPGSAPSAQTSHSRSSSAIRPTAKASHRSLLPPPARAAGWRRSALVIVEEAADADFALPAGLPPDRGAQPRRHEGGLLGRRIEHHRAKRIPVGGKRRCRIRNLDATSARTAARCRRASAPHRSAGRGCTGPKAASLPSRAAARSSPRACRRRPARTEWWQANVASTWSSRSSSASAPPHSSRLVGQVADKPADIASRERRRAPRDTATAPGPNGSITSPRLARSSALSTSRSASTGSRSTTAGISSICRAMPCAARSRFRRS